MITEPMTPAEAVEALKAAKLYARNPDPYGRIIGGRLVAHVKGRLQIRDVFILEPFEDGWLVEHQGQTFAGPMPLRDAVVWILSTTRPSNPRSPKRMLVLNPQQAQALRGLLLRILDCEVEHTGMTERMARSIFDRLQAIYGYPNYDAKERVARGYRKKTYRIC